MSKERIRGFEIITKDNRKVFKKDNEVLLPLRGSKTSAGYDFFATQNLEIKPQDKIFFWSDIKTYMQSNEMLLLDIRSSAGTKLDLMMANTIPLIDSDYYDNYNNEGNIGICIRNLKPSMKLIGFEKIYPKGFVNDGYHKYVVKVPLIEDLREENTIRIKNGERICQGFFVEYKESDNCNSDNERNGGFGSTDKLNQ